MANYKDSANRAKETATFRFTSYEKRLLSHLAELQNMTQTALIRALLAERAEQMGVDAIPEPPQKRKPGRPKQNISLDAGTPPDPLVETGTLSGQTRAPSEPEFVASEVESDTFGALIVEFQAHFRMRSDKMQRELENTIRFVTGVTGEMAPLTTNFQSKLMG